MGISNLQRDGAADPTDSWTPFDDSVEFTPDWWDHPPYGEDDPWYVRVLRDGDEVGRVKFHDRKMSLRSYGVDRLIATKALDVAFFEVSNACRRKGIGTEMVRGLEARHPDRILVAFSEGADDFWGSLDWRRYDHLTDPRFHRTLFVQE
jgi:GNAT superfamily N-acetyltransferase